jgi:DNA-directed RNA polymerase specialized sigma24 family protein
MYDTKLVIAAQEGDEAAFAALFDRNVEAVYDLCWALTGDEAEASRLVQDAFVLAARHIDEITDASQVRPWLLAIARDRALAEDEAGVLRTAWGTRPTVGAGDEVLGTGELRRWTREAGATLALADQAVLELATRHDLEGDQLAAAIGCAPSTVDDVLAQVDGEADDVLGALVVARQGRNDCPELAGLLAGWDGAPSVDVAEQVGAHAAGCERCGRRLAVAEPRRLVAAAAPVAPPTSLRATVLDHVAPEVAAAAGRRTPGEPAPAAVALALEEAADHGPSSGSAAPVVAAASAFVADAVPPGDPSGQTAALPLPAPAEEHRQDGPPWLIIAAAGLAVAVLVAIVALAVRPSPKSKLAADTTTTTQATPSPPTTSAPTTAAAPTLAPVVSSTTTSSTTPAAGRLQLDTSNADVGATATSAQVLLSDGGPGPVAWRVSSGVPWITAAPASGSLKANASVNVTVTIDRSTAPVGTFSVQVAFIATGTGSVGAVLTVTGSEAPPTTTSSTSTTVAAGPQITNAAGAQVAPCQVRITATITDAVPVSSAVVSYTLPGGSHGSAAMSQIGGQWTATVGGWTSAGSVTFSITASDSGSASQTSPTAAVAVTACP